MGPGGPSAGAGQRRRGEPPGGRTVAAPVSRPPWRRRRALPGSAPTAVPIVHAPMALPLLAHRGRATAAPRSGRPDGPRRGGATRSFQYVLTRRGAPVVGVWNTRTVVINTLIATNSLPPTPSCPSAPVGPRGRGRPNPSAGPEVSRSGRPRTAPQTGGNKPHFPAAPADAHGPEAERPRATDEQPYAPSPLPAPGPRVRSPRQNTPAPRRRCPAPATGPQAHLLDYGRLAPTPAPDHRLSAPRGHARARQPGHGRRPLGSPGRTETVPQSGGPRAAGRHIATGRQTRTCADNRPGTPSSESRPAAPPARAATARPSANGGTAEGCWANRVPECGLPGRLATIP